MARGLLLSSLATCGTLKNRNCSPPTPAGSDRLEHGAAGEAIADGGERGVAIEAAGGDDRADVGVARGAPGRAKAVRDFPENDRRAQGTLRHVVGRSPFFLARFQHDATRDEHEQLFAATRNGGLELDAGNRRRPDGKQPIEAAVEIAPIGQKRRVGELSSSSADGAGAFEKSFETGREHVVAGIDRILGIAQEMGEAELMRLGVAAPLLK